MASLVTEILSSAGKLDGEQLAPKIATINQHIMDMKLQVLDLLKKRYVEFLPVILQTNELAEKVDYYSNEIECLNNVIQNELIGQIRESTEEFKDISQQLAVANSALLIVKQLFQIHNTLEQSKASFAQQDFSKAVKSLLEIDAALNELNTVWNGKIKIVNALQLTYINNAEKLKYDLGETWKTFLQWSIEKDKPQETGVYVTLCIKSGEKSRAELVDLVQAMNKLHYLDYNLKQFTKRLFQNVIKHVVVEKTDVIALYESESCTLKLMQLGKEGGSSPAEVFQNLTTVFQFLHQNLDIIVSCSDNEFEKPETTASKLTSVIGELIYKDLYDILIKDCLRAAVPSRRKDLEKYAKVVQMTTDFHKVLVEMEYVRPEYDDILAYAKNVDSLFADKLCQNLLEKSRKLMMEELYVAIPAPTLGYGKLDTSVLAQSSGTVTQTIKEENSKTFLDSESSRVDLAVATKSYLSKNFLNEKLMTFPQCKISKSALSFIKLLCSIMDEAANSSHLCASRLFITARNIIRLYCDIVPCYHKDSLESLPQQSALLHNNCMYISHRLITLAHQYHRRLPESLDCATFMDLIPDVRKLGTQVFLSQMRAQKEQLISILAEVGDFRNINNKNFSLAIEKAVKQSLIKLDHLKKVWNDVLPTNVYCKAMGTLLNSFLLELITKVTELEDISEDNAAQLIAAYKIVTQKAPSYFAVDSAKEPLVETQKHVEKWNKFQELIFLLSASMQEILDRWASGKGPLPQEFPVDEVKQMIKALFQNTDRRAAVLAKIK